MDLAEDGLKALDSVEKHEPDILILDIIMPHLDGLGVLERLHKKQPAKFPKVIVLSAVGHDKVTQRAINMGLIIISLSLSILNPLPKDFCKYRNWKHPRPKIRTRKSFIRIK